MCGRRNIHMSQIIRLMRDFFHARRFEEVETAVLGTSSGGAAATPFSTYLRSFDGREADERDALFLRIAPELSLKVCNCALCGVACLSVRACSLSGVNMSVAWYGVPVDTRTLPRSRTCLRAASNLLLVGWRRFSRSESSFAMKGWT